MYVIPSRLLCLCVFASSAFVSLPAVAAPGGASASFSVSSKTLIPGETLNPGNYSIQIVDSLSDRMIVRIDSKGGKEHALFLGVRHGASHSQTTPDGVEWEAGPNKTPAIRGFSFPAGASVEFVYPKADAVALAKLNQAKVVAIDPESEGMPKIKGLSHDDLQVVNLWMLSLTTTGPANSTPAVLAQKYDATQQASEPVVATATPAPAPAPVTQPVQVAQLDRSSFGAGTANDVAAPSRPASRPVAKRHPAMAALPHTASALPLVWALGVLALLSAFFMRLGRLSLGSSR